MESGTQNRVKHNLRLEIGTRDRESGTHHWAIGILCLDLGTLDWARNNYRLWTGNRR